VASNVPARELFEVWPPYLQRLRGACGTGPGRREARGPLPMPRGEGREAGCRRRSWEQAAVVAWPPPW
jgi:hypothetical protein